MPQWFPDWVLPAVFTSRETKFAPRSKALFFSSFIAPTARFLLLVQPPVNAPPCSPTTVPKNLHDLGAGVLDTMTRSAPGLSGLAAHPLNKSETVKRASPAMSLFAYFLIFSPPNRVS